MTIDWMDWVFIICLVIIILPYFAMPFVIYNLIRFKPPFEVIVIDPQTEQLPEEVRQNFHHAYLQLVELGFELKDTMFLPNLIPNVKTLFALYHNPSTTDMAMTTFMMASQEGAGAAGTIKNKYVEFVRRFTDGVRVQTNNSKELSSFPPMPGEATTQFWDISKISRLYQLHCFLVEQTPSSGIPEDRLQTEFRGNAAAYINKVALEEVYEEQVGTGYLVFSNGEYRATAKGAFLMAYKELWPFKAFRKMGRKRRAKEILQELEEQTSTH